MNSESYFITLVETIIVYEKTNHRFCIGLHGRFGS
jgi:hypothetical protein